MFSICQLHFAKEVQTERNQACLKLPRCSLLYLKEVQTKRNQACFFI